MAKAGEPLIIGAALGNCAHVAGVANFLRLAAEAGFRTVLLGAAVPVERVVQAVRDHQPDALAVSYRLTPANGRALLEALLEAMEAFPDVVLLFGGTAGMVEMAEATGRFAFCFVGEEPERRIQSVFLRLRGEPERAEEELHTALVPIGERVSSLAKVGGDRRFVPLLRHHFGLPSLEETVEGVRRIAESEVLDVISVAPDQNAQEFFFRPDEMDPALDGAGGVPLRKPEDLRRLYEASRCGNYPYLRIYSGTRDLLKWAEMSVRELHNAWGTVPLTWYSELDGRSRRPIETAIAENLQA
ncbi:MAG: cobalamin B12-binding domain-containing protein, partial [Planctomycetes bacterium]|nr:cobalamin B12-binding domain-containing protein [Planctomycetota bacterium]